MKSQVVDVMVVYDIQSQSKSYPSKVFVDISGDSCIVFLCYVLADKQSLFWVARGAIEWVCKGALRGAPEHTQC